ncbi:hypothetical protein Scep_025008 [Stephania cephalantha]|uniref:FLZ-type domain-containing protein n=1 Tax=Stephania cephalantha TaxID=152367 RepID=A0AAP0HU67_9MAGN
MLGKRTRPIIGKLPDRSIPGDRATVPDPITSPKSPLDIKIRSPRGFTGGGIGLGIVAALEINSGTGNASDGQSPAKLIVGSRNLSRSDPIPIGGGTKTTPPRSFIISGGTGARGDWFEDYTCVTSHHGPNNKPITKIFFDEDQFCGGGHRREYLETAHGSSAVMNTGERTPAYPSSSFLSSCYLCRKTLHGRDIYMYRGEKAFCSTECRYKQMVSDERKEKCRSEASRSTDLAASPYSGGRLFSTGITAS